MNGLKTVKRMVYERLGTVYERLGAVYERSQNRSYTVPDR